MSNFELERTLFNVTNCHLNAVKGGKKKNRHLLSLNGYVEIPAEHLNEISRAETKSLQAYLFDSNGDPKDTGLGGLPFTVKFNDCPITLGLLKDGPADEYTSKTIHNLKAEPTISGHVKLYMQIQVYPSNAKEFWKLIQAELEPHYLSISAPPHQSDIEEKE